MKTLIQILRFYSVLGAVGLTISLFFWSQLGVAQAAELPNAPTLLITQAPQTITGTITTVPTETVSAGELLTYTIRFTSDKDIPLLTVSNDIPHQTTYVPNSIQGKAIDPTTSIGLSTLGKNTLIWNIGGLVTNDEVELSFVVTVTTPINNNEIITDLVRFSTSADELSHDITVRSQPKLTLTMTGPSIALANVPLVYTFTYSNQGTMTATNLLITDTWTDGLVLSETNMVTFSQAMTQARWLTITELSPLSSDQTIVLTFTTAQTTGTFTHDVELVSEQGDIATDTLTTAAANPQVALTQTSSVTEAEIGDTIVYSYQIQNMGDITLDNLELSDDLTGVIITVTDLVPSQRIEVTTTYQVTTSDEITQRVVNNAMVMNPMITATAKSVVTIIGGTLDFEVANVVTPTVVTKVGQIITYTYHVTNTGNVTLKNAAFTNNKMGSIQPIIDLPPSNSITRVQPYTVTTQDMMSPDSFIVDEVTLVGFDIFNHNLNRTATSKVTIDVPTPTPTATSTATPIPTTTPISTTIPTVPFTGTPNYLPIVLKQPTPTATMTPTPTNTPTPNPSIEVKVNANRTEANLGQEVLYEYTIRNTGNISLSQVKVVDSRLGDILTLESFNANDITTTTRSYIIGLEDLNRLENQVQATGQFRDQSVTKTDTINVTIPTTQLSLEGRNTGTLTLEIRLSTGELVLTCITENNQTSRCPDIHANIVYKVKITSERCGGVNITKSYPVGPFTQKGSC
jgi:uncharacterized repeat protein (TIGR01451 family)